MRKKSQMADPDIHCPTDWLGIMANQINNNVKGKILEIYATMHPTIGALRSPWDMLNSPSDKIGINSNATEALVTTDGIGDGWHSSEESAKTQGVVPY